MLQFKLFLANDRKLSFAKFLEEYDDTEIAIWLAYHQTIGLNDPHYDAALTNTILINQFKKENFVEFEEMLGRKLSDPKPFNKELFAKNRRDKLQRAKPTIKDK